MKAPILGVVLSLFAFGSARAAEAPSNTNSQPATCASPLRSLYCGPSGVPQCVKGGSVCCPETNGGWQFCLPTCSGCKESVHVPGRF
jgi:hypothetical protein